MILRLVLLLVVALLAGCGDNAKSAANRQEKFARFAENFLLRLQRQYSEPRTAPDGLLIRLPVKPDTVALTDTEGRIVLVQAETTDTTERDVRLTLQFAWRDKRWELTTATAEVIASAKRGKVKTPVEEPAIRDALADDVYAPRLRAALAATPVE